MVSEVAKLILRGVLVPVQVFGTDECCEHTLGPNQVEDPVEAGCEAVGHGLSDRASYHAPGGSDCNRAEFFLLRPSNEEMADSDLAIALMKVMDREQILAGSHASVVRNHTCSPLCAEKPISCELNHARYKDPDIEDPS